MNEKKRIILVLGPHRCGTSVITKSLEVLGVSLGDNLMGANRYNEKGYWEDLDFQTLNKKMLAAVGREWFHFKPIDKGEIEFLRREFSQVATDLLSGKFASSRVLGVKDPRFSLLMGFWKPVFLAAGVNASCVIALRSPGRVAASLHARNGLQVERGYWIWSVSMLEILRESEELSRVMVEYNEVLRDPATQCRKMADALGLELDTARLEEYRDSFLDSSLDHFGSLAVERDGAAASRVLAVEMYQMLTRISRDQEPDRGGEYGRCLKRWKELLAECQEILGMLWTSEATLADLKLVVEERKRDIKARLADIAWLREKARESKAEYEQKLLARQTRNEELNRDLESVEAWQRSWFRRVFSRWRRPPKDF